MQYGEFGKPQKDTNSRPVAVIDLETTGLYNQDRIIEIGVAVIEPDGRLLREWETLVNPERDLGPTHIHGIVSEHVKYAPKFSEIAGNLIGMLDGCVALAGHNFSFDYRFLRNEFDRCGHPIPDVPTICTRRLVGSGSLEDCCAKYGIDFHRGVHKALDDARATAELLSHLLRDFEMDSFYKPIDNWPRVPRFNVSPISRVMAEKHWKESGTPKWIEQLVEARPRVEHRSEIESAIKNYEQLLAVVLEDRVISGDEEQDLFDLAFETGLSVDELEKLHESYVFNLAKQAWADQEITDAERRDLFRAARLLGISEGRTVRLLKIASEHSQEEMLQVEQSGEHLAGKCVCFTGECLCVLDGARITRSESFRLAEEFGLTISKGVTKKTDILVIADPDSQSGKAKKARQYGIRIMQVRVFWRALGLEVS